MPAVKRYQQMIEQNLDVAEFYRRVRAQAVQEAALRCNDWYSVAGCTHGSVAPLVVPLPCPLAVHSLSLSRPHATHGSMSSPAPSNHAVDTSRDLNQLVKNPPATFFFRVSGDDMAADCLHSGDLLIVDRFDPVQGCLVVAALEGALVVRRVHQREGQDKLKQPGSESDHSGAYEIWGVVTTVIHSVWQRR